VNPEDAAAARFRPIAKARERIAKTEQAHAAALARLEAFRGQLAPAERRDSELLGEALVEGKREPLSEAEAIRTEVAQQELRAASDLLGGRVGDADGRAPLSFTAVVAELRRDGDAIAAHPVTRHDPHPHLASDHVKLGALLGSQWGGE
jgi:hypothetical protein